MCRWGWGATPGETPGSPARDRQTKSSARAELPAGGIQPLCLKSRFTRPRFASSALARAGRLDDDREAWCGAGRDAGSQRRPHAHTCTLPARQ
ncbi:unnamed protein product [Pieris macdunnoughi]|uniref:Uncharacterized protein n=1 Tax=Pieris macdunnoughi TaxID=345717 RepID=A0A821UFQ9_9NEOP|nr:unnamed protein product [Pieris macdunnoughi]